MKVFRVTMVLAVPDETIASDLSTLIHGLVKDPLMTETIDLQVMAVTPE